MAENIIKKTDIFEGGNPFDDATKGLAEFLKVLQTTKDELKQVASINISNINKAINKGSLSGEDYQKVITQVKELNNIKENSVNINNLYKKTEKELNELFAQRAAQDDIYYRNKLKKEKENEQLLQKQLKEQASAVAALEKQRSAALQKQFQEEQKLLQQKREETELRNKQNLTLKEQSKLLALLRNDYRNLSEEELKNTKVTQTLLTQITALDSNLKKHDALLGQHQRTVGQYGIVWQKVNGILASAGIYLGLQGLINFGKEVSKVRGEFEKFEAVLTTTLGGDRSRANNFLNEIAEFAAETPFQVEELTNAFIKLANRGIELTIPQMRKLGDVAAALGKPFEQLNEAILDVNNQKRWTEIGIKASTEGDKVKLSWKGVTEVVERSEAGIIQGLENFTKRVTGVSGQMAAISQTTAGKLSNLKDNFDLLYNAIGKRFQDAIQGIVDGMVSATKAMREFFEPKESENLLKEITDVNSLVNVLIKNNNNADIRNQLLDELQAKYPDYFSNLNREKDLIGQINERLELYNKAQFVNYEQAIRIEREKEFSEQLKDIDNQIIKVGLLRSKMILGQATAFDKMFYVMKYGAAEVNDQLTILNKQREAVFNDFMKFKNEAVNIVVPEAIKTQQNKPKEATEEEKKAYEKYLKDRENSEINFYKKIEQIRKDFFALGKDELKKEIQNENFEYINSLSEFRKFIEENSNYLTDEQKKTAKEYETWIENIHNLRLKNIQEKFDNEQIQREYNINKIKLTLNNESNEKLLRLERDFELKKLSLMSIYDKDYEMQQYKIMELDKKIKEESYEFKIKTLEKELNFERGLISLKTDNIEERNKQLLNLELKGYEERLKIAEEYLKKEALLSGSPEIVMAAMANIKELQNKIKNVKNQIFAENAKFGSSEYFAVLFGVDSENFDKFKEGWEQMIEIVDNSISSIIESYQALADAEYQQSQTHLENSQKRIDTLYNQLAVEADLNRQGLANNANSIRQEIENEKKKQKELEKQRNEAFERKKETDRLALITDSILQASNIATAISNLFSSLTASLGPLGTALAVAASATLLGSFIAQKTIAFDTINAQTPKFATGVIDLQGKGTETSDSIHAKLSKGESVMTAKETKQAKNILTDIRQGKLTDSDYKAMIEITKIQLNNGLPTNFISVNMDNKESLELQKKLVTLQSANNKLLSNFNFFDGTYYIDNNGNRIAKQ